MSVMCGPLECGSLADWFAASAGLGSVGAVFFLAWTERKRRIAAEERNEELQSFYRRDAASRCIMQIRSVIASIEHCNLADADTGNEQWIVLANQIGLAQSNLNHIRDINGLDQRLSFLIKDATEEFSKMMAPHDKDRETKSVQTKLRTLTQQFEKFL